jgi:hypothetical protein
MPDLIETVKRLSSPRAMLAWMLCLAGAALVMNAAASWKAYGSEPLREAASRSLFATGSRWFYDSGLAEPLPVGALKAAMAAGADPDTAVRAEGLAAMFLLAGITVFALKKRFGAITAYIALLFFGANPYLGYYAMQGGSHLYALAFLLLYWHFFSVPERPLKASLAAGLCGGLALLSRLDSAWPMLIIAVFSLARGRRAALKPAAAALGLAFALALPYAAWQKAHYGRFAYAQEVSLGRWAGIDRYGYAPHDAPRSGPMGPAAFLLRDGPAGALRSFFYGLGRSLAYELPRVVYYRAMIVLVFLGVYAAFALKKEGLLVLLAAVLLPLLPLAAIKQVPATGGIELRYYLGALWVMCALAGLGLQEIMAWLETQIQVWAGSAAARY